ncbi:MAG: protein kinase, partial [Deltaproteobacteria bacterium]|nr:protein kinase [Deltaproteobacteria bacterium]
MEQIGRGGMAEVFRAKLKGIGGFEKIVAVKRILPSFARDPAFRDQFLAEAKLSAQLTHPNIVSVFEVGIENETPFMILEWIDGFNLKELMNHHCDEGKQISIPVACEIAIQIARALQYAHSFLSPENKQ